MFYIIVFGLIISCMHIMFQLHPPPFLLQVLLYSPHHFSLPTMYSFFFFLILLGWLCSTYLFVCGLGQSTGI